MIDAGHRHLPDGAAASVTAALRALAVEYFADLHRRLHERLRLRGDIGRVVARQRFAKRRDRAFDCGLIASGQLFAVLGKLTLGLAALLLLALYLGKIRRTGSIVWTMPLSANLVLRNFGLTIFLAQVGIASGPKFFATVATQGPIFLLYGALIALSLVAITAFIALVVFRLPFDTAIGVISGATGNPAILAFSSRIAPTDRPDVGYAMIFPSMTILKILFAQVAAALFGG